MATDNKRIFKNTLFLYFRMFLVMGVSILTAGVTLRVLGEVDYGLYAVLGGIVAMFSFLNGSIGGAASRHITYELGRGDYAAVNRIFNVSLMVFVSLAVVIVLLSETVGVWFFYNKMTIPPERVNASFWVLQISIINVPLLLTQVPYSAVLIAHENMKIYAYVSIADAFARLGIIGLLIVSPFDKLVSLSLLGFGWSLVTLLFYRIYCIRKYTETRLLFCKEKRLYKGMLAYAGSDLIGNLSALAQGQGFNLLLNVFFGPAVNAARGIAYGLQGMTTQFSGNFMTAVAPQIIKSFAQGDRDGMWQLVKRSSCFSFYLVLMLALPACLEGDYVLTLWLGKYPDHTLNFFYLVMIVCLLQTLKTPLVKVVHANGKLLMANLIVGSVLCLAFPVGYVFLRIGLPPESIFWATIGSMAIGNACDWFVCRHYVPFSISDYVKAVYGRCIAVIVLSPALPYFLIVRNYEPSFARMISTGLVSILSVSVVALSFGMTRHDRMRLLEVARNRLYYVLGRVR